MQRAQLANDIQHRLQTGFQHQQKGAHEQAQSAYRSVLKLEPRNPQALGMLGVSYLQTGDNERASNFLNKAHKADPKDVQVLNNLGMAYRKLKKNDKAIDCFRKCLKLDEALSAARMNLAITLKESGKIEEALGEVQIELNKNPKNKQILFTYGNMLIEAADYDLAIESFQSALALDPSYKEALVNLGNIFKLLGRFDEALGCYDRALALDPENDAVKVNKGMILLARGQYKEGWSHYEKRIKLVDFEESNLKKINAPKWTGQSLNGKTILVHTEQGFGDTLQFCRYVSWVKALGADVILYVDKKLKSLMSSLKGVDRLVVYGESVPKHDYRVSIMSLPHIYYRVGGEYSFEVPYLSIDPALVEQWTNALASSDKKRVGIIWQGNPGFMWDKYRSIALENYLPIIQNEQLDVHAIQVFDPKNQLNKLYKKRPELKEKITDLGKVIRESGASFDDTAAIFHHLDVIITSDTSVAHLAGALGLPVWLVAGVVPDFRWGMKEQYVADYPSMRIFRQKQRGDWLSVFEEINDLL